MLSWWLPENVSTYGQDIDYLFNLIYYITGGVFILVAATMIAFLVMYRYREGRRAPYTHGNTAVEILWTVIPTLIPVVPTGLVLPTRARAKMSATPGPLNIDVTA